MQRLLLAAASFVLALAVTGAPRAAQAQAASAPAPSASPAPAAMSGPAGTTPETFVIGDYLYNPRVYNAASSGQAGLSSYEAKFGAEFKIENMPFMVTVEDRDYAYNHVTGPFGPCPRLGCVQQIENYQQFVPGSVQRDTDKDGTIGYRIAYPRVYVVVAYLGRENSFNYPVTNGVGLGIEKLPDEGKAFSVYFQGLYFPDLEGKLITFNPSTRVNTTYTLTEHVLRYQFGVAISPLKEVPAFFNIGLLGDGVRAGASDPNSATHLAGYAGVGLYAK